ncbi:MAG: OmpA family protein [Woeseiaceae bacterium]
MNAESEISNNELQFGAKQRCWRKAETPEPWFPHGLLHLAWLAMLFLIGALLLTPVIEADVRKQVSERLHSAGIGSAIVSANGQAVSIRADENATNEMAVKQIARLTRCSTWAGNLPCPTTVAVALNTVEDEPRKIDSRPHQIMIDLRNDTITLSGEVPNLVEQQRILDAAKMHFSQVNNELAITNLRATENYSDGVDGAIGVVSHLEQGYAKWSGRSLSVLGFARADEAVLARDSFDGAGTDIPLGAFSVRALDESAQCDQRFKSLLASTSIRFKTGSAALEDGNEPVFERIARLSDLCTGLLRIEGHTDSQGDAEMNKELSALRADAVRAALESLGVESDRLLAVGYGEERPIADNSSDSGRAANRRIAITVQQ